LNINHSAAVLNNFVLVLIGVIAHHLSSSMYGCRAHWTQGLCLTLQDKKVADHCRLFSDRTESSKVT